MLAQSQLYASLASLFHPPSHAWGKLHRLALVLLTRIALRPASSAEKRKGRVCLSLSTSLSTSLSLPLSRLLCTVPREPMWDAALSAVPLVSFEDDPADLTREW